MRLPSLGLVRVASIDVLSFLTFAVVAACGGAQSSDVASSGGGASSGTSGGSEDGGGASESAVVCTSNSTWSRGNRGSELMHPGVACIACHTEEREGPRFVVAGTVYPTAHEPDDCSGARGMSSSPKVVITDASGKSTSLSVNSAGNFFSRTSIALPYTAKVVVGAQERVMVGPQTSGDCNSCHTEQGTNGAPGRIALP